MLWPEGSEKAVKGQGKAVKRRWKLKERPWKLKERQRKVKERQCKKAAEKAAERHRGEGSRSSSGRAQRTRRSRCPRTLS